MNKKYMKKCTLFLAIKKIQIKIMLRFHLIPVKTQTITKVCKDVGENEPLHTVDENVN
jgi:hypothetical protein